jgi:hypothetical protein
MRRLLELFGARKPARETPPDHEVVIHFSYGSTNLQYLYALEDSLRIAVSEAAAGRYDGYDVADDGGEGFFYLYGPDAEVLFRAISPVLSTYAFMRGATVTLWFGPAKRRTPKRVFQLP